MILALILMWLSGFTAMGAVSCFAVGDMRYEGAFGLAAAAGFLIAALLTVAPR